MTGPDGIDSWDEAPCGLVRLDRDGIVLAANARFLERTGYGSDRLIGRTSWRDLLSVGSRLLYETQLAPILRLDGSLSEIMLELRSASGDRIPVLMDATRDPDGQVRIALMTVPDRKAYEAELRRARDEAEHARSADSHTRARLELLSRANEALANSDHVDRALDRLARVLVADLADWCIVYAVDPNDGGSASFAAAHRDPRAQRHVERLATLVPQHALPGSGFTTARATGAAVLRAELTETDLLAATDDDEMLELCRTLDVGSTVVAPAKARHSDVATIILGRGRSRTGFVENDLTDATDLGARTAIVIDNLYRHAREHRNSVALQQALLTAPPSTPVLEVATRYLPSQAGNEVGGDWYDVFLQEDGTPVLVIGDVVGHDIQAAATMGQLRGITRTLGFTADSSPADILTRTDVVADGLGVATLATVLVARVEGQGTDLTLRWSSAGHLPVLVLTADGDVEALDRKSQLLMGIDPSTARVDHTRSLRPGDSIVLYTDGLVERVDEALNAGIDRLSAALRGQSGLTADELCDRVVDEYTGDGRDDIALLIARVR